MEHFLVFFYSVIFLVFIFKHSFFEIKGISKWLVSGVFVLKIIFGFTLYWIYTHYYGNNRETSDAFRFFDDGLVLFEMLKNNPVEYLKAVTGIYSEGEMHHWFDKMGYWYAEYSYGTFNDNRTLIRMNGLFCLLSFGYYHVHTIFMCMLSFTGLLLLFKTIQKNVEINPILLFIAVFMAPSVLLWGSGVLKEGILLLGIGLFLYYLFETMKEISIKNILFFGVGILLLLIIKPYILVSLSPAVLFIIISNYLNRTNVWLIFISVHAVVFIAATNVHYVFHKLNILRWLQLKQRDFINVAHDWNAGSYFEIPLLERSGWSIIKNSPVAFLNSLFRPFLWDCNSIVTLFPSAENIAFFFAGIFCIYFSKPYSLINKKMLLFIGSFIVISLVLMGLLTPVSGALVRYKMPVLPFMLILFFMILDTNKLAKKLPFINKITQTLN